MAKAENNKNFELIKFIIEKKGLLFGEFELKSKRISPYFFNLANIIMDGVGIYTISEIFAKYIHDNIGLDNIDFIFGPAYKGIPLAGTICLQLSRLYNANKRWGYDRKESKDYGDKKEKWLVGKFKDNDRILIVDDVITTGITKIETRKKIEEYSGVQNLGFLGILILLDRQEKTGAGNSVSKLMEKYGLPLYSILKIRDVFDILKGKNIKGNILVDSKRYKEFETYINKYGL
jgi:orotate phosphoribosyltransferase